LQFGGRCQLLGSKPADPCDHSLQPGIKQHRRPTNRASRRRTSHRAQINQLPTPTWASSLAVTWERVGNPIGTDGSAFDYELEPVLPPASAARRSNSRIAGSGSVAVSSDCNPLLDEESQFPLYADIKPEHVAPGIRTVLAQLNKQLDELEAGVEPTYEDVLHPLERMTDRLERTWGVVGHLKVRELLFLCSSRRREGREAS